MTQVQIVVKNRVHLDIKSGNALRGEAYAARIREEAERLKALRATELYEKDEPTGHWITMRDPEGNEFCVD